jgi:ABC-type multidrug transport system permease subunit
MTKIKQISGRQWIMGLGVFMFVVGLGFTSATLTIIHSAVILLIGILLTGYGFGIMALFKESK